MVALPREMPDFAFKKNINRIVIAPSGVFNRERACIFTEIDARVLFFVLFAKKSAEIYDWAALGEVYFPENQLK